MGALFDANGRPRPTGRREGPVADTRERWRINPDRSALNFTVGQQVWRGLKGKFHCWGGLLLLDKGDPNRSSIRFWVDLSSFDAGSAKHNQRIEASGLLDAQREPALVFDSDRVHMTDAGHGVLVGRLAVHCVDRAAAVSIEAKAPRRDALGVWHLVYEARTSIDFGVLRRRLNPRRESWWTNLVWGEAVQIAAHIEAAPDAPASSPFPLGRRPRRGDSGVTLAPTEALGSSHFDPDRLGNLGPATTRQMRGG